MSHATTVFPAAASRPTSRRPTSPELPRTSTLMPYPLTAARRQHDGLVLGVVGQRLGAALPAEPGVLEPAEGPVRVEGARRVDRDRPGPDPRGHRLAALEVGGPHRAGQAVLGVVGQGDRLVLAVITDDGRDRPR